MIQKVLKIYTRLEFNLAFLSRTWNYFLGTKVRYSYSKAYDMDLFSYFYYNPM